MIYESLLLTPSDKKKEVALDLTFEHHLLARPSLAGNERTKMKKKAALKNKKKATSRNNFNFIFLQVLHLFVTQKIPKAYFGGNKLTAQALQ